MKTQNLILGLMVFFFVSCSFVFAQPFETIQIGDGTQKFTTPVWSPDGRKLALRDSKDQAIFVADAEGKGGIEKITSPCAPLVWIDNNRLLVAKVERLKLGKKLVFIRTMKIVSLRGEEEILDRGHNLSAPIRLNDGTVGYFFNERGGFNKLSDGQLGGMALKQSRVFCKYKETNTDIWLESLDKSVLRKLFTMNGACYSPLISPDETKIVVAWKDSLCVLSLDGEILGGTDYGDSPAWSPDSKHIAYAKTEDDGHRITKSELYTIDADGTNKVRITDTPEEVELHPTWSPDGTKIACWSDNTGKIFVIKLK
jgi:WD40 repeat protein